MPQARALAQPMCLLIVFLSLAGAGGVPAMAEDVPLPKPRPQVWVEPQTFREAAGPDFNSAEVTSALTECDQRLQAIATIELLPRLIGPDACGGGDMVRLQSVSRAGGGRIELKPTPVLRCAFAESVVGWLRDEAAPQVDKLDAALRAVEIYDDYECRGRNRGGAPSSANTEKATRSICARLCYPMDEFYRSRM